MRVLMGEWIDRPATMSAKNALLWGLFWMLGGAILGWYFALVPTSSVGYTWGSTALIKHVIYGVVIWVALALPTLLVVWFARRESAAWEVFGRILFAHMPITFLMFPAMFGSKVAYSTFMRSPFSAQLSTTYIVLMSLYVAVILVWYLYWSFVAFRHVAQFKGWLGVMIFGATTLVSYILSEYAILELRSL